MKKFVPFLLMIAVLCSLSACGRSGPREAGYYWHERYPHGILTEEERQSREETKQMVSSSLPPDIYGQITGVSLRSQYVAVSVSYSNDRVKNEPDGWAGTVDNILSVSEKIREERQEGDRRSTVLYICDSRKILLTVKDGEVLYDRFKKPGKPNPREIDPEILEKIEAESIARIKASGEYDRIMSAEPSSGGGTVYVSKNGIIHSIPNCSGMSSYRTMSRGEADSRGYRDCQNCW